MTDSFILQETAVRIGKMLRRKVLEECLINAIEVSPFDKATAYIATTRYKFNDHRPGLYKTTDYGN